MAISAEWAAIGVSVLAGIFWLGHLDNRITQLEMAAAKARTPVQAVDPKKAMCAELARKAAGIDTTSVRPPSEIRDAMISLGCQSS